MAVCALVVCLGVNLVLVTGQQNGGSDELRSVNSDTGVLTNGNVAHTTLHSRQPRYLVVASRILRPDTVYRVAVTLPEASLLKQEELILYPLQVRASISGGGVEVTATRKIMSPGDHHTLLLKIPSNVVGTDYSLRVEGDARGSYDTGGSVFSDQTSLLLSPRFLTILIQTNRPLYSFGQTIRFRVLMLRTDLKPFDDAITVYVLDSEGYIMRRWVSVSSNNGVVSLSMKLPFIGKGGQWRIRAVVRGQATEKHIQLTKYFVPQWEVFVLTPTYILLSEDAIVGEVWAGFTNDRVVTGSAVVELWTRPRAVRTESDRQFRLVTAYSVPQFAGSETFSIPMTSVTASMNDPSDAEVKVLARVTDFWYNETYTAWCNSRLINSSISVRFLGTSPQMFKPGMTFRGQVMVTYHDNAPLPPEMLQKSSLTIRSSDGTQIRVPTADESSTAFFSNTSVETSFLSRDSDTRGPPYHTVSSTGQMERQMALFLEQQQWKEFRTTGVFQFSLPMTAQDSGVDLTARFQQEDGVEATASLRLEPVHSESSRLLSVSTSTDIFNVGEYGVFHLSANFPMTHFFITMTSKNLVVHSERIEVESRGSAVVQTFSVAISSEMPPSVTLTAYHVSSDGELVADSLQVSVEGINRGKTEIILNQLKDPSKNTVELGMVSNAGATFCTFSTRDYLYSVQAGHDITHASVMRALHSFQVAQRPMHHAIWRQRDGRSSDRVQYFTTGGYGSDTNATFALAELVVLTDAKLRSQPNSECGAGMRRCLTSGCYNVTKHCDGFDDCVDKSDESQCSVELEEETERKFRLTRRSLHKDLFDEDDGDWAWRKQYIGYLGIELRTVSVPKTNENWYISGFSVSNEHGLGLLEQPLTYDSSPPFYITLEMVEQVRRGETVVARTLLVNNQNQEVLAMIVLKHSDTYRFIHVEENGVVMHLRPRTSAGDHQHLVPVAAGGSVEVSFPLKPTIELGELEVQVECITQFSRDVLSATVNVIMEGVPIGKHTSLLLDLKNRAVDNKFFNVFTDRSPEITYELKRSFVYGSPQASVTVSGDVVGPMFPHLPMTTVNVFGRWLKCVDGTVFNFGYNIWSLRYRRWYNQLTPSFLRRVLSAIAPFYVQIMKRYRNGAFLFYDGGYPSIWATAWTIRQLHYSQFQDWENYLYVEPRIMSEAAQWITLYQNEDGSFNETEWYQAPLDQKMDPRSRSASQRHEHVPLTAHVLITLSEVSSRVQGAERAAVLLAQARARQFLERALLQLRDAYEIAITAHALSVSGSGDRDAAFSLLQRSARRESSGLLYWAREPLVPSRPSVGTNQRPYVEPKNEQVWDAQAVEATAHALLVYLERSSASLDIDNIVHWLNTMRMFDNGWISTVDSLMALQALTTYSYKAQLKNITNMQVSIDYSAAQQRSTIYIAGNQTQNLQQVQLENVWGHVAVIGRGSGLAVVQLDLSFGIDQESLKDTPPRNAFFLSIREHSTDLLRNKSIIAVQAEIRWTNVEESSTSGAAVLEVEFPSGYRIDQQDVNALVVQQKRGPLPNLMSGKTAPDRVFWFFDRVHSNYTQTFSWTIFRRYLVANYTAYRSARIYEYFAPERFEMQIINSNELYFLDVCQVCGSYQCPYCPWYSGALRVGATCGTVFLLALLSLHWLND